MGEFNSLRSKDNLKEKLVNTYLWNKVYTKFPIDLCEPVNDFERQMKGVDLVMTSVELNITKGFVDEKAQLHYLNGGLPTFAFELNFLRSNGQRVEGWLTHGDKLTDYYLLSWIKAKDSITLEKIDDIEYVEYIIIERKKILEYLSSEGFNIENLRKEGLKVAKLNHGAHFKEYGKSYYFFKTEHLAEKPVNIVIYKKKLIDIAVIHGKV